LGRLRNLPGTIFEYRMADAPPFCSVYHSRVIAAMKKCLLFGTQAL